tara:strand:+ start:220 stop:438 length:219 start_codon:yes stop_codon:yes gene_type:complete
MTIKKTYIDINQYIQYDEKVCDMIIYFNKNKFLADALEYLQNDNQDYKIIMVNERFSEVYKPFNKIVEDNNG